MGKTFILHVLVEILMKPVVFYIHICRNQKCILHIRTFKITKITLYYISTNPKYTILQYCSNVMLLEKRSLRYCWLGKDFRFAAEVCIGSSTCSNLGRKHFAVSLSKPHFIAIRILSTSQVLAGLTARTFDFATKNARFVKRSVATSDVHVILYSFNLGNLQEQMQHKYYSNKLVKPSPFNMFFNEYDCHGGVLVHGHSGVLNIEESFSNYCYNLIKPTNDLIDDIISGGLL